MGKKEITRRDFLKGVTAGAAGAVAFGVLDACSSDSVAEAASTAVETTAAQAETEAAGVAAKYTPGTYTASAQGLGTVQMTATFDENQLIDISLDLSNETPTIGGTAEEELISQCMAAETSADIDGVSGATLTSNAVRKCYEDCVAQASGTAVLVTQTQASDSSDAWLGEEPEITDDMVDEELDADVLVIGCGVAGVAAVRSAAEEGVKVVAVDKAAGPQCRSGEYAVINGKVEATWGRDTWTSEQIQEMTDFHMQESCYKVKQSIFHKWATNIGDVFDWWIEPNKDLYIAPETRAAIPDENADNYLIPIFYPLPEAYDYTQEQFPCYPTSVEFLPDQSVNFNLNMDAAIATGNVTTRYGYFAEKLIMEDGRCVGAYMRNAETGGYLKVNASRGVILATGDYSQNDAMVEKFCPDVIENNIVRMFTNVDVEGNFTNQGDGIRMGVWAGAKVQQDHAPMIHHMGGGADLEGVGVMGIAPFLNLDMNGRRFMNEDIPGQQIENQIERLKDQKSWQIFDASWPEELPYMPAIHGGACYYEPEYDSAEDGPANNQTYRNYKSPYQLEAAVEDGRCLKADTLEELVELMYPDNEAAQTTALDSIARYNELCEKGYDEDFGKTSRRMFPLNKAPYYADQFETALCLVIIGGLESDEDCHVYNEDRDIIPGLYAAGNVQGSRFAAEYPITLKGVSHSMAMYYGYVAGKNAAK